MDGLISRNEAREIIADMHGFCRNDVLCDAMVRINALPEVKAITMEWLKEQIAEAPDSLWASLIKSVMNQWQKEQEAR